MHTRGRPSDGRGHREDDAGLEGEQQVCAAAASDPCRPPLGLQKLGMPYSPAALPCALWCRAVGTGTPPVAG